MSNSAVDPVTDLIVVAGQQYGVCRACNHRKRVCTVLRHYKQGTPLRCAKCKARLRTCIWGNPLKHRHTREIWNLATPHYCFHSATQKQDKGN
jgi:hypothetical protein